MHRLIAWLLVFVVLGSSNAEATTGKALRLAAGVSVANTGWTELAPPARTEQSVIYDPIRDRLVVFGGSVGMGLALSEVWCFSFGSGGTWTRLETLGECPARQTHAAFYDPAGDRMIVFGGAKRDGRSLVQEYSDVWALTLGANPEWTLLSPSGAGPDTRSAPCALFDPTRNQLVTHGGTHGGTALDDTWIFDLASAAWSNVPLPPNPGPNQTPVGAHGAAVYDSLGDRLIVFGDYNAWSMTLAEPHTWTQVGACGTLETQVIQNPIDQRLLGESGGQLFWTQIIQPSGQLGCWNAYPVGAAPPGNTWGSSLTWDSRRARVLLVGGLYLGAHVLQGVWGFAPGSPDGWHRLDTAEDSPAPRYGAQAVYDPIGDRILMMGGFISKPAFVSGPSIQPGALWAIPLSQPGVWHALTDSVSGSQYHFTDPDADCALLFDPTGDRLLFFGNDGVRGLFSFPLSGPANWTPVSAGGTPPESDIRIAFAAIDVTGDRAIFAGTRISNSVTESVGVWAVNLSGTPIWSRLDDGLMPPATYLAPAVYDAALNRLIAWGDMHVSGADTTQDMWALSLAGGSSWQPLATSGIPPAPYFNGAALYDPVGQRMMLVGGQNRGGVTSDTWTLSLDAEPTWARLSLSNSPQPNEMGAAVYDSKRQHMVLYGGAGPGPAYASGSLWALDLTDDPTPALVSLVNASVADGRVQVRWLVAQSGGVGVERRDAATDWQPIADVFPDGAGYVDFTDAAVARGRSYGYRLRVSPDPGGAVAGEVWVDVPASSFGFALAAPEPNPAAGDFVVRFTLPDNAPASLELLDISGRHLETRNVGGLGAGSHSMTFGGRKSIAPGIYFLRLRHAAGTRVVRTCVVR